MSFLKFATWNVRGFRDRAKQRDILAFAQAQRIDVLFIQETNFRTPLDVSRFRREFQVDAFFSLTTARACGVGVIFVTGRFRQKAFCTFGANGRMLMLDMYVNGKRFRFVNVYAPVTRTNTNNFFQDLHQSLSEPLPHVLLGDFNCVIDSQRDVRGPGRGRSTYQAKELVKVLRHLCLTDVWLHVHGDLFVPTRSSQISASTIDRTYLPDFLLPSVAAYEVLSPSADLAGRSDHLPLATTLSGFPGPCSDGQGWRLDSALLQDDDSIERTRERLQESVANAPDMTPLSWEALKEEWRRILQEEGRARKRRITTKMKEILRRIRIVKGAESLTPCTRSYLNSLEVEYAHLLQWRALRPPKERDKPANPIVADPNEANGNGSVRITRVKRPDGSSATDPDGISLVFCDYFAALFRDTDLDRGTDEKRLIEEVCRNLVRLEGEETASLGGEATAEEVSVAITSMPPNSAPGTDGLTANFYATFFDVLEGTLLAMVNVVVTRHAKPKSFDEGRIVLLLKEGAPQEEPSARRPITLLNVHYKIVASLLNNRLKLLLPSIVAPRQSCVVPGRSMFSNLTVTRDAFEYMTSKSLPGAFVSLDQAKASDRVRHRYMFEVLRQFGLPECFVDLVSKLYRDLTCHVVVNGAPTPNFDYERGIRQGCPLGHTPFILSLEPLLANIERNESIRGFPLTGEAMVKVLAYAHDVSLFVRDPASLQAFWTTFASYAKASGAELNMTKSKALPFGAFPLGGLGNLEVVDAVKTTWKRALERAQAAITRLSLDNLTLREKALAAKTTICAFAYYASRIAVMPTKTATQLSKMIGSFLWEGKPAPVRRTLLQLPESEGGLGLSHVLTTSKVFALKTARALYHASNYVGRHERSLPERGSTPRPLAESPSSFYKSAANTMRMLEKEAPNCDVDEVPPARIAEEIARHQITPDECRMSRNWKRKASKDCRGIPRSVDDFVWRKHWDVFPTRQRLHKFGIVPSPRCCNCRADETLAHALFDCPVAKPVWRLVARDFIISPPPELKRNRGAFAKLVVVCTIFTIWKRRCLAEARR
ncbi:hypothetical protein HPB52_012515 [Rhipicephalus sanguineus]|uniref:Reverse transcriptase domain-containing protein n=1 Tax=Rhipicephalus sanguineus TaxID=34632 RepID=A0A9D4T2C0_RHISA|nr:hypothetical protein HPB52_012515 [Rhipicephalus sanguineus]